MKLLFTACPGRGVPTTSPFGVCPECENRQTAIRAAAKRRIHARPAVRGKRAA